MSLRDHLRVLQRRKWPLILTLVACAGSAAAYSLFVTPSYEVRAQLVMASDSGSRSAVLSAAAPVLSMLGEPVSALGGDDLATQVQIIESRPTLQSAWGIMQERPEMLQRLTGAGLTDGLLEELPEAIEGLGDQPPPGRWPDEWQALLETLRVAPVEDSKIIEVCCEAPDAARARDFANALVLAYLGRNVADERAVTRRARVYVDERLADVEMRLAEAEESLRQLGSRAGTVALDESARQQIGLLVRLNEQAALAESTLQARRALREELEAALSGMDDHVVAATVVRRNPEIVALQGELAQAEAERARLLEDYAPEAMPVRRATAGVSELRERLRATAVEVVDSRQEALNPVAEQLTQQMIAAEGEELAARESMRVLEATALRVEGRLAGLPGDQVALLKLQREIELLERFYLALKEKQQEYEITERSKVPPLQLLAHAIVPEKPARPRKLLTVAAGLAAGLLLGLLAAGAAEQLDDRLHDAEQAAAALGLPVLGTLGRSFDEQPADARSDEALQGILRHLMSGSGTPSGPAACVLAEAECIGRALRLANALARQATESAVRVLVLTPEEIGLGEGAPAVDLSAPPSAASDSDRARRAVDASEADLLLAVPAAGDCLLSVAAWLSPRHSVVVIVELHQTRATDAASVVSLAREHGGKPVGLILMGARTSSSRYLAAPART